MDEYEEGDLIGDREFEPVSPRIGDSGEWVREYGAVDIDGFDEVKLVWSISPEGEVSAGTGGWIRCHLNDSRVKPVTNEAIPTYIKLKR